MEYGMYIYTYLIVRSEMRWVKFFNKRARGISRVLKEKKLR